MDLSLLENQVGNNEVIDAFHELIGGKGPNDEEILEMLDDCNSDPDESDESDDEGLTVGKTNVDHQLYEELKLKLKEGKLRLDRTNDQDKELCFLLETDDLQPYELIRLRNVYSCWEQLNTWRVADTASNENEGKITNEEESAYPQHSKKRTIYERDLEVTADDEPTPNKRRKLLETFGLSTPSPLVKKSHATEIEMKQISVAVHLWAERKMGGIKFLQSSRLNDSDFEDILKFTGPESKCKLMKGRTLPQLRSLWRNTVGGKHFYRGHNKTGFENEHRVHFPSDPFCPFGHCNSGIMSPMDIDLIVLTPKLDSEVLPVETDKKKRMLTSRKLFEEDEDGSEKVEEDIIEEEDRSKSVFSLSQVDEAIHDECDKELSYSLSKDDNEKLEIDGNENSLEDVGEPSFHCKIDGCGKVFQTFFGFERHNTAYHAHTKLEKEGSTCPVCKKTFSLVLSPPKTEVNTNNLIFFMLRAVKISFLQEQIIRKRRHQIYI